MRGTDREAAIVRRLATLCESLLSLERAKIRGAGTLSMHETLFPV